MPLTVPLTKAKPERGASAIKQLKSRNRSSIKNDLLNTLLIIKMKRPDYNSKEAKERTAEAAIKCKNSREKNAQEASALPQKVCQLKHRWKFLIRPTLNKSQEKNGQILFTTTIMNMRRLE